MEPYLSVQPSQTSTGEGLFTARKFSKNDVLCERKFDYFALSDEHLSKACQSCAHELSRTQMVCTKCSLVYYCSKECQNADINLHELECLFAQRVKPNRPTQSQRILLRALKHKCLPSIEFNIDNTDATMLGYFLHGLKIIKQVLSESDLPANLQQLLRYQCMLKFACLELESGEERIGIAYSGILAKVNHSCLPNCVYVAENNHFRLIAIKPLKENDEITISYLGDDPSSEDLKKYFGFTCTCSECNKK